MPQLPHPNVNRSRPSCRSGTLSGVGICGTPGATSGATKGAPTRNIFSIFAIVSRILRKDACSMALVDPSAGTNCGWKMRRDITRKEIKSKSRGNSERSEQIREEPRSRRAERRREKDRQDMRRVRHHLGRHLTVASKNRNGRGTT